MGFVQNKWVLWWVVNQVFPSGELNGTQGQQEDSWSAAGGFNVRSGGTVCYHGDCLVEGRHAEVESHGHREDNEVDGLWQRILVAYDGITGVWRPGIVLGWSQEMRGIWLRKFCCSYIMAGHALATKRAVYEGTNFAWMPGRKSSKETTLWKTVDLQGVLEYARGYLVIGGSRKNKQKREDKPGVEVVLVDERTVDDGWSWVRMRETLTLHKAQGHTPMGLHTVFASKNPILLMEGDQQQLQAVAGFE